MTDKFMPILCYIMAATCTAMALFATGPVWVKAMMAAGFFMIMGQLNAIEIHLREIRDNGN